MIKFPQYTRKENLACKLSDNQIKEIQNFRKSGTTYAEIAKIYNVSPQAIFYWCLDKDERKRRCREATLRRSILQIPPQPFNFRKYRQRKKQLHPELKEYEDQFNYKYKLKNRPNYPVLRKLHGQRYWKKHKEKLTKKNKKYQLAHLGNFRKYNKKHREKYLEKVREQSRQSYQRNKIKRLAYDRMIYRQKFPIIKRKTKYSDEAENNTAKSSQSS